MRFWLLSALLVVLLGGGVLGEELLLQDVFVSSEEVGVSVFVNGSVRAESLVVDSGGVGVFGELSRGRFDNVNGSGSAVVSFVGLAHPVDDVMLGNNATSLALNVIDYVAEFSNYVRIFVFGEEGSIDWPLVAVVVVFGCAFLLFYVCRLIGRPLVLDGGVVERSPHLPLRVFLFVMGLLVVFSGLGVLVKIVETTDLGVDLGSLSGLVSTLLSVWSYVLYVSLAWLVLYLLFGIVKIGADMAGKGIKWRWS